MENTSYCDLNNRKLLREVIVEIGLERIDIEEGENWYRRGSDSQGIIG